MEGAATMADANGTPEYDKWKDDPRIHVTWDTASHGTGGMSEAEHRRIGALIRQVADRKTWERWSQAEILDGMVHPMDAAWDRMVALYALEHGGEYIPVPAPEGRRMIQGAWLADDGIPCLAITGDDLESVPDRVVEIAVFTQPVVRVWVFDTLEDRWPFRGMLIHVLDTGGYDPNPANNGKTVQNTV